LDINGLIINEINKGFIVEDKFFQFAKDLGININFNDLKDIVSNYDKDLSEEIVFYIFTPDFEMRKRFALIWLKIQSQAQGFNLETILKKVNPTKIVYKELSEFVNLDKEVLRYFFKKLGLLKKIDKKILATLNNFDPKEKGLIASFLWKDIKNIKNEKISILNDYLKKSFHPFLFSKNEFIFFLNILGGWKSKDVKFHTYLKKLFYIYNKAARQAVETSEFLKNNNVETFMIQGGRVSFANPDEILEKKNLVWEIASRLGVHNQIYIENELKITIKSK